MKTRTITNTIDKIDVKVEGILNDLKTGIILASDEPEFIQTQLF